jgi:beta-xylosidase
VCLGVRKIDGRYPLSRETFLTPVDWPVDGWTTIAHPKLNFTREAIEAQAKIASLSQLRPVTSDVEDTFIRRKDASKSIVSGSTIRLKPTVAGLWSETGLVSFLGKRQRSIDTTASVNLDLTTRDQNQHIKLGLALYKDERRHAALAVDKNTQSITVDVATIPKQHRIVNRLPLIADDGSLGLRIVATNDTYTFSFQHGFEEWEVLRSVDTNEMVTYDFTGPLFGVFAQSIDGDHSDSEVIFNDFVIG